MFHIAFKSEMDSFCLDPQTDRRTLRFLFNRGPRQTDRRTDGQTDLWPSLMHHMHALTFGRHAASIKFRILSITHLDREEIGGFPGFSFL